MFFEQPDEHLLDGVSLGVFDNHAGEHESTPRISNRQWLAALCVASAPPTLEVYGPHIVWLLGFDAWDPVNHADRASTLSFAHPTGAVKNPCDGALTGRVISQPALQHDLQFLWAPSGMSLSQFQNRDNDILSGC
ncbi:MAG: hypothetical protein BWY17_04970 [Deltaproteobacteria bacterium ADurb.Bin207]|jgi:hypothetical protein|nr:MAG: hypothetical protein BWY17_04970 [Deltaproteobacteria bacterium ADurb.Bin207]